MSIHRKNEEKCPPKKSSAKKADNKTWMKSYSPCTDDGQKWKESHQCPSLPWESVQKCIPKWHEVYKLRLRARRAASFDDDVFAVIKFARVDFEVRDFDFGRGSFNWRANWYWILRFFPQFQFDRPRRFKMALTTGQWLPFHLIKAKPTRMEHKTIRGKTPGGHKYSSDPGRPRNLAGQKQKETKG